MNAERLIELMKEHFSTKGEFLSSMKEIRDRFDNIDETLSELKATASAVDKLLEAHPVERITRLEQHVHLSQYVHTAEED